MTDLYTALEKCLQAIEQGESVEQALSVYPEFAEELYPLLELSLQARNLGMRPIPDAIRRRGRQRVLEHAARLRQNTQDTLLWSFLSLWVRPALLFGLAFVLLFSSIGLINGSASALPGDYLYPVKRTWENLRLSLTFNPQERQLLISRFEQERLNEIEELLARGRVVPITFSGLVESMMGEQWLVAGIPVRITDSTRLPQAPISEGMLVAVQGITHREGVVEAFEVQLLSANTSQPGEDDDNNNRDNSQNENNDNSENDANENSEQDSNGDAGNDNNGNSDNDGSNNDENDNGDDANGNGRNESDGNGDVNDGSNSDGSNDSNDDSGNGNNAGDDNGMSENDSHNNDANDSNNDNDNGNGDDSGESGDEDCNEEHKNESCS